MNSSAKNSLDPSLSRALIFFSLFFFSLEGQKDENDLKEEQEIFEEMMQVIEQRNKLVDSLEEQRVKERTQDQHFENFVLSRGCQLSRTWSALPRWSQRAKNTTLSHPGTEFKAYCLKNNNNKK